MITQGSNYCIQPMENGDEDLVHKKFQSLDLNY